MKQAQFEKLYAEKWHNFSLLLEGEEIAENQEDNYQFISLYRLICQHYALAKQRHYSPQLVKKLHDLVITGHHQLYAKQGNWLSKIYHFYAYTFPNRFRQHKGLFWLSFACFTVPLLLMGLACYFNSEMLYSLMSSGQVREMESMYDPNNPLFGRESSRQSDTDLMMFGHYISNNIGIDFRIYGIGLFAGIGTLFLLLYNGLVIGGVAGHLTGIGFGERFWAFVVGHGSFELTACVISGMAGLRLAQSLFMTGNYGRADAFKIAGKQSIELLIGAGTMTFIAAFIEAFWSSSSMISDTVKYVVAVLLWSLVIGYLALVGKKSN
ncbi:MAG: stage II sporulation protein M [Moraxellaceae bacterium]|nr:stage II sporulation protein M [Moraxellaceae bacterium]